MVNHDIIGPALGKIPSGVGVLTANLGGEEASMLASWFQQVAFEPPMISVAVNKERPIATLMDGSESFVLNLFKEGEKDLFGKFVSGFKPGVNPFEGVAVYRERTGAAILSDALSYLECKVINKVEAGDHFIYFGEVIGGAVLNEAASYVHLRKNGFKY
jgi:flavin reductase (DIM6/NTAB) family NADH-FMN oxidoreductase RutF